MFLKRCRSVEKFRFRVTRSHQRKEDYSLTPATFDRARDDRYNRTMDVEKTNAPEE